ncbi:MAG: hypothetical protein KIT89_02570 [Microcella sp.]|uniref:hypothetical protein n=1 Tax=Microcella sp. TaxID=1913979 RepID=UPI0024C7DC86|nr:hypothetical protein [Microcella sp.]UYN84119.1 MAG: hypothetical protein KIT89_02570 [Microcella sp.]
MPQSVEQWWARRQCVTGEQTPYAIGRYRDAWAPFTVLVEQFRPERNGELVLSQIPPAADVYLVWVCSIGHEFVATPTEQRSRPGRSRSSRSWCPVCAEPSALRPARRWPPAPVVDNSGQRASVSRSSRVPARVAGTARDVRPELLTPQAARRAALQGARPAAEVRPGEAFVSAAASHATSAMQGELRRLLEKRLDLEFAFTAVRVRTPFFGKLEVWPDVIVAELAVAIELDTVGRNGDEHVGRRERSDRRKDQLLREVGWHVIRLRCRPLRALGPDDLVVAGVSASAVDALIERIGEVRGALLVEAYCRSAGA